MVKRDVMIVLRGGGGTQNGRGGWPLTELLMHRTHGHQTGLKEAVRSVLDGPSDPLLHPRSHLIDPDPIGCAHRDTWDIRKGVTLTPISMLRTKSVYSPIDRHNDGLRILVTRFRGRGMRKTRYDVWMPSLGPTERTLRAGQRGILSWTQFSREFRREMLLDGPIDSRSRTIKNHGQKSTLRLIKRLAQKGNVTLMCHCDEDQEHCHRDVLRAFILSGRV